jgi:transposase
MIALRSRKSGARSERNVHDGALAWFCAAISWQKMPIGWHLQLAGCSRRHYGITAPFVLDDPINGECFKAYVENVLVPTLAEGDIVLIDNLSSHKSPKIRKAIEARGAELHFLPRYSPDFNPIEMVFSKLKTLLRKASERTIEALWNRISELLSHFPTAGMPKLLPSRRI